MPQFEDGGVKFRVQESWMSRNGKKLIGVAVG
jgi:hypothetical protein